MRLRYLPLCVLVLSVIGWAYAAQTFAQEQKPANQSDDVIRVDTAIVQTDVMVFDKQGGFIDNLKRDQFVLKIDGKPREISFFERITAGSRTEEAQIAAARGVASRVPSASSVKGGPVPLDRGRVIFFVIDDLHLSPSSVNQTRLLLARFINREMGQNDEAAITCTSGQIGFLQQLTDNKMVLTTAAQRLKTRAYTVTDSDTPAMSEYQALLIDRHDQDVLDLFVDEVLKQNPSLPRQTAAEMVRGRATQLLQQAGAVTTNTLTSLWNLIKTSARLPGRKIIFLVSDGFFLDPSDAHDRIRQITLAAAAAGVVIYSVDARGLTSGMPDATTAGAIDLSGRLENSRSGELVASQDGLNVLANDTGGRAFFNSNLLSAAVSTALKESSVYYLLAWRPEPEEQRNVRNHRIEVSVSGRSDVVVRFRRGFASAGASEAAARSQKKPPLAVRKQPLEELQAALRSAYPSSDLPVFLSLNFVDVASSGLTLTTSMKVATDSLVLESQAGPPAANLDIAGVILDEQGKMVSNFQKRLTIKSNAAAGKAMPPESIGYNHSFVLKPGIYQARVAALDEKQGLAGSATQWIEIPDLASKTLALSTLIVGEERVAPENHGPDKGNPGEVSPVGTLDLNVDHRFTRSSRLRFLTFIYNALRSPAGTGNTLPLDSESKPMTPATNALTKTSTSAAAPDLAVMVQVFRDNEPVITTPLHKIQVEGVSDMTRLPYAAEVRMEDLQPGRYVLQVTVIDRLAKASASQRFSFEVD